MCKNILLFFIFFSITVSAMEEKGEKNLCGYCLFEDQNAFAGQNRSSRSGSLPGLFSNVQISPRNKPQHFCEKIAFGSDEGLVLFGFFEDVLPELQAHRITQLANKYMKKAFANVKFDLQDTPKTRLVNIFLKLEKKLYSEGTDCGVVGIIGVVTNDRCICASLGDSAIMYGNKTGGSSLITKPHVPKPDTSDFVRITSKGGEVQRETVKSVRGGKCIVDCKKVEKLDDSSGHKDQTIVRETYWVCEKSLKRSTSLASLMKAQASTRVSTSGMLGKSKFKKIGVTATPKVFEHTFTAETKDAEFLLVANGNFWRVMHKHKPELTKRVIEQKIFSNTRVALNSICRFVCMLATGKRTFGDLRVMIIPHPAFFNYERGLDKVNNDLNLGEWKS